MVSKRSLTILVIILSILVGALGILNFKRRSFVGQKAQILGNLPDTSSTVKSKPEIKTEKAPLLQALKISSKKVIGFQDASENAGINLIDENGVIEHVSFDGNQRKVLRPGVSPVAESIWSPTGNSLIERSAFGAMASFYNIAQKSSSVLHQAIKDISFSPDGGKIVYHFYDPEQESGTISISQPDGKDYRNIFKTRISDMRIFWPTAETVVFYSKLQSGPSDVFTLQTDGSNFHKIISSAVSPNLYWSHDGQSFLAIYQSDTATKTQIFGLDGSVLKELSSVSGPTDCRWTLDNKTIYCAKDGELGKINIESGNYESLVTFSLKPIKILLSPLEDIVVLKNADGALYSIRIK